MPVGFVISGGSCASVHCFGSIGSEIPVKKEVG